MRKIYFLLFTLIASASFGQNIAVNGDFESWTAGVVDSWTSESGTTITQETITVAEGTSAVNFEVTTGTQGNTDFRQAVPVVAGVAYDVSVQIYQVDALSQARLYADGYQGYSDETLVGEWQTLSYVYNATTTGDADFGLRFYDAAGFTDSSFIIVDNFQIVAQSTPGIAVTAPTDGSNIYTTDVDVELSVQNFDIPADGNIKYSVDGGSDIIKSDTTPIALTGLAAGSHTVNLELVDTSNNSLSTPVTTSVTFTIIEVQTLPFIDSFDYTASETLGEQTPWTNYFSGDDILVETGSLSYSTLNGIGNSISFDGSGADPVVEYTPTSTGTIYASFMLKVTSLDASATDGYFAVLRTDGGDYASRLWISPTGATTYQIGISNGGTLTEITSGTDFNIDDEIFVVFNYDIDNDQVSAWLNPTLGAAEPTADITEASSSTANTFSQFLIRQDSATETPGIVMDELRIGTLWAEVTPTTLSTSNFNKNTFAVYPNPVTNGLVNISSTSNQAISVAVFDVLGKQVINQTVTNNTLNVASLNSGIYIVKLSQNGNVSTKKLVIK
ncbi:T9SS type A sorting domain-containing protein [Lacinutrix sp. C3R15]|uniref:T9SS type A sorting domain-containing protein n=1 Tax=Flavobacteriaceae TaxID=49546 RepID=UPI001C09F78F|nr:MULTISPECIES: T9SS type A sorting domain-containing protein [Flavobacteriaceae]MBU2939055.1 T9SS type A sorting domain-containing protein [Lacinutrix sp. C3R15]MDO6622370.1 T9SS type A sorting domain-containing protein [Oceanihabitans sp. 1_MG-2023]